MTTPLTREQVELRCKNVRDIGHLAWECGELLDHDAALRQTIKQQAQEIETLTTLTHTQAQEAAKAAKAYAREIDRLKKLEIELGDLRLRLNCPPVAPSCLVCGQVKPFVIAHLEASAIGVCEECRSASQQLSTMTAERDEVERREKQWERDYAKDLGEFKQQLAAMTQERDVLKADQLKLQKTICRQRTNLSRKYLEWAETKVGMQRTIEYLRAKTTGETPMFGHGAKDEIIADLHRQLAAAQARVKELEGRRFPILRGPSVPWSVMLPHESMAQANHDQSLEKLASRGGLSPGEAWCVVSGIPCRGASPEQWALWGEAWNKYAEKVNLHCDEYAQLQARCKEYELDVTHRDRTIQEHIAKQQELQATLAEREARILELEQAQRAMKGA